MDWDTPKGWFVGTFLFTMIFVYPDSNVPFAFNQPLYVEAAAAALLGGFVAFWFWVIPER